MLSNGINKMNSSASLRVPKISSAVRSSTASEIFFPRLASKSIFLIQDIVAYG